MVNVGTFPNSNAHTHELNDERIIEPTFVFVLPLLSTLTIV
jgi:hypothetical protein